MHNREFLLPPEGVAKGCSPFSLRDAYRDVSGRAAHGAVAEKAGMREYKNQSVSFSDPLTLTLSRRERGLLQHPPAGEGVNGTAVVFTQK
jgi:hypothetical protein